MNFLKKEKEQKTVENEQKKFTLNKEISQKLKEIKDAAVLKLQDPKVSLTIAGGSIVIAATIASIAILGSKEKAPESVDVNASTSYSQSIEQEQSNSMSIDSENIEEIDHYKEHGVMNFYSFPEFSQVIEPNYDWFDKEEDYFYVGVSIEYPDKIVAETVQDSTNSAYVLTFNEQNQIIPYFISLERYLQKPTEVLDYLSGEMVDFTQVNLENSILVPSAYIIDYMDGIRMGTTDTMESDIYWTFDLEHMYITLNNVCKGHNITNEIVEREYIGIVPALEQMDQEKEKQLVK